MLILPSFEWTPYLAVSAINWSIYGAITAYSFTRIKEAWKKGAILGFLCGIVTSCVLLDALFIKLVANMPSSKEREIIDVVIQNGPIVLCTTLGAMVSYLIHKRSNKL